MYLCAAVECGRIKALQHCADCARTHRKRGSADTKRLLYVHMYTAGNTKLSQYCLLHTHAHLHTYNERWMLVAGFVMPVLSMEPKHTLTLQSFYHQSNMQRYRHSARTQVPRLQHSGFNKWCHHKGKLSSQHPHQWRYDGEATTSQFFVF